MEGGGEKESSAPVAGYLPLSVAGGEAEGAAPPVPVFPSHSRLHQIKLLLVSVFHGSYFLASLPRSQKLPSLVALNLSAQRKLFLFLLFSPSPSLSF